MDKFWIIIAITIYLIVGVYFPASGYYGDGIKQGFWMFMGVKECR